ncbi:MAG: RadC family protein [Candidatus Fimivivens sp.]
MSQIHTGHRERLRKRMENEGLNGFQPHEILELILFYSIPRADTNPIAHRLLAHFGSLSAVLEAPRSELMKIEGIGAASATLLSMIPAISRRYLVDKNDAGVVLDSPKKLGEFIHPYFIGTNNEQLYLICLDKKRKLLNCTLLAEGSLGKVSVDMRLIIETVVRCSASSVALAHNHTQGFALPSHDDIRVTSCIADALKVLSVDVVDHIIVARDDYVSFAESGLMITT